LIASLVPILLILSRGCDQTIPRRSVEHLPAVEVYFSPRGGCTEAIVREIENAQSTIRVQAYSFTSAPIAKALADARKRGIDVAVILDDSQESEKYSSADFLLHAGIATGIDGRHAIAHNKVMVLDGRTVITGSFNFTKAAEESNAENLLIIRDATIAELYAHNWQAHAEHSQPYEGRRVAEQPPRTPGKPASKKTQKKTLPLSS
jgi:phosphatidylserine/phosphatidylglycerophosphate/cardiolipin synthase-like enzyme